MWYMRVYTQIYIILYYIILYYITVYYIILYYIILYIYIHTVNRVSAGSPKLKTLQISHAQSVFPQTVLLVDLMLLAAAPKARNGSKEPQMEGRPRQWLATVKWLQAVSTPLPPQGCLSLNRLQYMSPCLKDLQGNMDKDWDPLWFHTPKRSFKIVSVICCGFFSTRLQPLDSCSHGRTLLQDLALIVQTVVTMLKCVSQKVTFHYLCECIC